MLLNKQSLQQDRGALNFKIISLPGAKTLQIINPATGGEPHFPPQIWRRFISHPGGRAFQGDHSVCGNKLSLAPYNLAEQHLLEILLENTGQFTGVCDCQVGEYVNHLITNVSLRRVFKHTANETGKLVRIKPFFKICNYFKGVPYLKYVLHEKQFVLTQETTYGIVL